MSGSCSSNKVDRFIILVAPNVSEQMGGEAIKALQIFHEIKKLNANTIQITHERCEAEIVKRLKLEDVYFVRETRLTKFLWRFLSRSSVFGLFLDLAFGVKAVRLAERLAKRHCQGNRRAVIHQTEPNSPVLIRKLSEIYCNVLGPINGNIYYPKIFQHNENFRSTIRRRFHIPIQRLSGAAFSRRLVGLVLAAGGERTVTSLIAAGYRLSSIKETVDCGIRDEILDQSRIVHEGENFKFVHYGRLVFHKGTFLAIESLKQADARVTLDIIGSGPELQRCRELAEKINLGNRVNFVGWFTSHQDLLVSLKQYRGMVLPSFEDANGIVVQEAMAMGLPPICLNWGGPQLLIEQGITGFLIDPSNKEEIVSTIAKKLNLLAKDASLAERLSVAGRVRAEEWRWSRVANDWIANYPD